MNQVVTDFTAKQGWQPMFALFESTSFPHVIRWKTPWFQINYSLDKSAEFAGVWATYMVLVVTWMLIALAKFGLFGAWPLALPGFLAAIGFAGAAWWKLPNQDRLAVAAIALGGCLLYMPPAEHIPLMGDAAIYPNEAAYIARTGGIAGVFEPLAPLAPEGRELFFVSNVEQLSWIDIQSYKGILYGGYYLRDLTAPELYISRMPQSEVWYALLLKLFGMRAALYSTGIWSILALTVFYLTANKFVNRPSALWSTLLLAVTYPQVHFSKASYAEIPGQFWTLLGFYFAVRWVQGKAGVRAPWQLVTVLLCWVTTWAGRIDALMLLGALGLLLLLAASERDQRSLGAVTAILPLCILLLWLGTNALYVVATYEMLALRWYWFTPALIGLLPALLLALLIFWKAGRSILAVGQRVAPLIHTAVFTACLFVVGWATLPNPLRSADVTRTYQEIIWYSSQYITPLFYWLALAGVGWLLWRGYDAKSLLLLVTVLSLGLVYFYKYTSANVYPVSMRRLIGDVVPLMTLLAGVALAAPWPLPGWRFGRWGIGLAAVAWMLMLSWPVIQQHEAGGSLAFVEKFHDELPADGVFIFEVQDADSWVGWLAAPLFSLYGDWSIVLDKDDPDPRLLAQAVTEFEATGRTVYLVSQQNPLPAPLTPSGYEATLVLEDHWRSSLIGQTRAPYPPPYWEFEFPVNVYKIVRL